MLPFQDPSLPEDLRVEDLLQRLTLEEKIHLGHQLAPMKCGSVPRLGIGPVTTSDGPQGFRLEDGRKATALPCGAALASTWDESAAERYGAVIGREGNALDIQVILGPGINLMRTPLNGRTFEYFGEDPFLAGSIGAGYVRGCQREKVAACPKHLALNNQELCRTTGDSRADERTIRELYTRSFKTICQKSRPWMMMSSYNKINGVFASENGFLQQQLVKDEFGFDGVMVSDWGGAHSAKGCALGGLDLDMGENPENNLAAQPLLDLVRAGEIPESVIDERARRMIRLMLRTNVLTPEKRPVGEVNTPRNQAEARQLATEGMVLLRNNGLLPLDRKRLKKLAVIGPSANFRHNTGDCYSCGGSGCVHPPYDQTVLEGLREACGSDVEITYDTGCGFSNARQLPAELTCSGETHGLKMEYFDSGEAMRSGTAPYMVRNSADFNYFWCSHELAAGIMVLDREQIGVRWSGKLIPAHSGKCRFSVYRTAGLVRCVLDGKVRFDENAEGDDGCCLRTLDAEFEAEAGKPVDVIVEFEHKALELGPMVRFLWEDFRQADFSNAVALAAAADAVIYVGGSSHNYDKEGIGWGYVSNHDIPDLELPGRQRELLTLLAEANPRLAVVLINGSVLSMDPWLEKTAAVLEAWYPGQETGHAVADVLFGDAEPGGRLPCTFGRKLDDYACHALHAYPGVCSGDDPYVEYPEGVFIGYRHFDAAGIEPRFPFGFGLSYTSFECKLTGFRVNDDSAGTPDVELDCQVTNTGKRRGSQVVQLYVADRESAEKRPLRELRGFGKAVLAPGESASLHFRLGAEDFAYWPGSVKRWVVEPGDFSILLGTSSRDFFAEEKVTLQAR